jgi:hypothetical protein
MADRDWPEANRPQTREAMKVRLPRNGAGIQAHNLLISACTGARAPTAKYLQNEHF